MLYYMIRETVQHYIFENLIEMGNFELSEVLVTVPTDSTHGDYMTSVALSLGKKSGQNPQDFARALVEKIKNKKYPEIEKIEIAGPGFINITLTKEAIRVAVESTEVLHTTYAGKKVLVEHSSPNLFKPFHIGHLMNNVIGEAVVRMMRAGGAETVALSFPSDVSLGIAKAMYILEKDGGLEHLWQVQEKGERETINYLGDCYVRGVKLYEEQPEAQEKVKEIASKIYTLNDYELFAQAKKINIDYFAKTVEDMGTHFDGFIYESEAGLRGTDVVKEYTPSVFTESEGAIVYIPDEERKDLNTLVFINSQGNPTYEAKDIGLIDIKFSQYNPDFSFYITDNEQVPHFKVVFDAYKKIEQVQKSEQKNENKLEWEAGDKNRHVPHGRMTFKGAKMSSRLGGVPLAEDTIAAVLEEVRARSGEHIAHLSAEEQEKVQRDIALSALRIAILRARPGSNINFDPDTSLSFEGDSGPYLLYTHARCASLLDKGSVMGIEPVRLSAADITDVERKLLHYKEVLTLAIDEIAPQRLVTYLFELAQEFNSFYNDTTIIVEGDAEGTAHRLYIVSETKKVLKNALNIIGINAPERM
jgi:arginyl-tRNA synthetase